MSLGSVDAALAQDMLDQLQGAQIASSCVADDQGLHVYFADGRVLVIAGYFALSLLKSERLH